MTTLRGKVSWFGGPNDTGVAPDEGLAFIYDVDMAPELFLDVQPPDTTGLARRLDPDTNYIACRWDYDVTPKEMLPSLMVWVHAVKTGRMIMATPADWGPHEDTGRIADVSPAVLAELGIETDDEVVVEFEPGEPVMHYRSVVVSSGHGKYVRGASGVLDEVDEARRVVDALGTELRKYDVTVKTYHDDVSKSQNENLNRIVDFHNAQTRELDVSIHFNAFEPIDGPRGTEVCYVTQDDLAKELSAAIATCGFINRGHKFRDDLFFLNNTSEPAVLIEVCFVDSDADATIYEEHFAEIVTAISDTLRWIGVESS